MRFQTLLLALCSIFWGCRSNPTVEPSAPATTSSRTSIASSNVVSTARGSAPHGAARSLREILAQEGHYAWSDGTSVYRLDQDHSFSLNPLGISGRTVEGKWTWLAGQSSKIQVFGRWSWLNGASVPNDFRKMTIHLSGPSLRQGERAGLYKPFFGIEELVKISKEEYEKGVAAAKTSTATEP